MIDALADLSLASLELLKTRELLRRIDAKYVVPVSALPALIRSLAADYAAVPVGDGAIAIYRNLYFDTPSLQCFHDHRRGRRVRRKIRIRHYPDRKLSFLEVKTKQSDRLSEKERRAIDFEQQALDADSRAFLAIHAPGFDELVPTATIEYRRISLLHREYPERLTIDFDLEVRSDTALCKLGPLAIIELKHAPGTRSPTRATLGRERSVSKYCTALALLQPALRHNRFRPALRVLEGYR